MNLSCVTDLYGIGRAHGVHHRPGFATVPTYAAVLRGYFVGTSWELRGYGTGWHDHFASLFMQYMQ